MNTEIRFSNVNWHKVHVLIEKKETESIFQGNQGKKLRWIAFKLGYNLI